ncbi:MAG: SLBB domain-containing protein [Enterocloster sp.]
MASPQNFSVRLGTSYQELLEAAGGFKTEPEKVLSGGPMMGQALFNLDIPVTKTSSATDLLLQRTRWQIMLPSACIRCGRCVSVCPSHVVPQMMMRPRAERSDIETFERIERYGMLRVRLLHLYVPGQRGL